MEFLFRKAFILMIKIYRKLYKIPLKIDVDQQSKKNLPSF